MGVVIDTFQKFASKFRCPWAIISVKCKAFQSYPGLLIVVKNILRIDRRNTQKIHVRTFCNSLKSLKTCMTLCVARRT